MSGPQRQQLADVETVTPALTDKAVIIQAGKVKTSLYSAIYDLFKTGYDTLYLTASSLTGYATETYANSAANTALNSANSYTDLSVSGKQDLFDYSGSASGTTSVTINGVKGGVAEFTQVIAKRTVQSFRINSNIIESTSKIIPVLVYNGSGYPFILSQKVAGGRVDILVANGDLYGTGGTDTNASIFIEYQIVG